MLKRSPFSLGLIAGVAALCVPAAAQGPVAPAGGITVTATRVVGKEAARISGTGPASRALEVALYVTYSRDIPSALMQRRVISTDASGRFDTTITTAPAFFHDAVVTVTVHAFPAGPDGRASFNVGAPNVPVPPDDIPASVR